MSVTEPEVVIFLALGAIGAGGVILHYAGYIPRPYRERLEATEATLTTNLQTLPAAMGLELEAALDRVAGKQRAEMEKELTTGQINSQLINASKNFKFNEKQVNAAISEAILGPALPILRQFAPGLASMLEENPQLVDVVINNPLFKKYVAPRIEQFLGKSEGTSDEDPLRRFLR